MPGGVMTLPLHSIAAAHEADYKIPQFIAVIDT
jgi:hypothetical protein